MIMTAISRPPMTRNPGNPEESANPVAGSAVAFCVAAGVVVPPGVPDVVAAMVAVPVPAPGASGVKVLVAASVAKTTGDGVGVRVREAVGVGVHVAVMAAVNVCCCARVALAAAVFVPADWKAAVAVRSAGVG